MLLQNEKLLIRNLKITDSHLLVKWLSNPVVLQYYEGRDNPHDLDKVMEHYYHRSDERVTPCIIEYDGVEIGYIQFYPITERERNEYGYTDQMEIIFGTDQFIGEADYWNKGVGKLLVHSIVDFLITKKSANRVVMDPQVWNERAVTCYERCGFKKVKFLEKHELHEGVMQDCWLVEYTK
ncbi:GNAT family N-acetyltransferase [Virgibacillus flavescens]|uniref:GNAT family N-acetyltransferase n=1 Tax=Virgibacillus flavescens TaxID=1611422 RepID=UPI003D328550